MIPLSFAQRRMWLTHQLEGGSESYNISPAFRLIGPLDEGALVAAIRDVVDRHETLRTTYVTDEDGEPHQQILPMSEALVRVPVVEVAAADLSGAVGEVIAHHFDLSTEIPLRVALFRCSPQEHVLVLVIHHIATDGSSASPLVRDLSTAYAARREGRAPEWEPLAVQYKDYAVWQRELLGDVADPGSRAAAQAEYWRAELAGVPQPLSLPLDRPRPAERVRPLGGKVEVVVGSQVAAGLQRLADEHGVTMAMLLQAGLGVLFGKLGGGEDVTIGSPIAGRTDEALADLVGFFVNTQVLRVDLSGDPSFADLLARVREKALAAYEHQDLPFETLVELINPDRSAAYQPLFQVMFAWQNWARQDYELPGLTVEFEQHVVSTAMFDLFFSMAMDDSGALWGDLMYATQLFDRETAETIATRLVRVLEQVAADPQLPVAAIEVLSGQEREWLLREVNQTAHPVAASTLPDAFEGQVERGPDRIAVVGERETLTYAEFNRRANQLAHWLVEQGAGPERIVAVRIPRSVELMVAIYAVVKAGATYLPVDTELPEDRVRQLLDSAEPVLTLDETLPEVSGYPETNPERVLSPDNAAYVIYTSGSTGGPKGVQVSHRSIMNRLEWGLAHFDVGGEDRMLFSSSASFDASVPEMFAPLQMGAAVVIARPDGRRDPSYLAELIQRERVTSAVFVPSQLETFLAEPEAKKCTSLRWAEVVAEPFPAALANSATDLLPGCVAHNLYGPTEATVEVTAYRHVPGADRVPIGTPIWNTQVYVLDQALRPVAPGVTGELYLAGTGLARGYLGQAALTAERFIASPYGEPGTRMYRTGDLVRRNKNNHLEYIGRTDFQIKLRGFRIELGEIENVLTEHPDVAQAAVITREDDRGDKRLVAYVVPDLGTAVADTEVQVDERTRTNASAGSASIGALLAELPEYLRGRLPDYMVPAAVVPLSEFPLTAGGKLDRQALPSEYTTPVSGREPRNAHEEELCSFFCELLGLEKVGIDDNFFELGGHSLLATRLSSRIRKQFRIDMPVRTIVRYPTVAELAALVLAGGIPDDHVDSFAVVLPLNRELATEKPPVWFFHGGGGLGWPFFTFAPYVQDRPSYALQSRGFTGTDPLAGSVEEMIEDYLGQILQVQPEGPYHLVGWSFGGPVAHAIADGLDRRGHQVGLVAILDSMPAISDPGIGFKAVADITPAVYRAQVEELFGRFMNTENMDRFLHNMSRVGANNTRMMAAFESPVYRGDVLYFHATADRDWASYASYWQRHVLGSIETFDVDATHHDLHMPKPAGQIMKVIARKLAEG
ncbi:non-ribosomal peptide synthetase [Streptomyces albipurpureus]|uniref:Amino acid adenylation domain-containing protein n=1 Tax=Streptomyces albipurpureus TaxID=2897419 RepID=A0ABT0UN50_9ACTN|nr:non-ribosomal peptide synthetase [Streptomyces sp. CWNU-1]MCM2390042.1 amino acid adenylation domain-containing protein [Streptomyces sp. CWNU-1]